MRSKGGRTPNKAQRSQVYSIREEGNHQPPKLKRLGPRGREKPCREHRKKREIYFYLVLIMKDHWIQYRISLKINNWKLIFRMNWFISQFTVNIYRIWRETSCKTVCVMKEVYAWSTLFRVCMSFFFFPLVYLLTVFYIWKRISII